MRVLHTFEPDEVVLGMTSFKELVIVCTTKACYRISGDRIVRIPVVEKDDERQ